MLVTPFGLNFAKGMALSVDDAPLSSPLPFLTCIPSGCLVPVVFDADQVRRLQSGTKLTATGSSATEASDLPITLSLVGFSSAMSRAIELAL
ncbi:Invasion associated locus B (IalB) protein [compost metagenome]